jgi:hypothetical protein
MKYNIFILIIILTVSTILTSSSCKKTNTTDTEEQLPPETQTGAFTFGCKVDGKIYTAKGKDGLLASQFVWGGGVYSDSSIKIGASNSKQNFSFFLSVKYNGNLGMLYTSTYPYYGNFQDNSNGTIPGNSNTYTTDSFQIGKVNLKYVIQGNVVSGTFEMDAKNTNGKIIRITEGRFDIGQ